MRIIVNQALDRLQNEATTLEALSKLIHQFKVTKKTCFR